MLEVPHNTPCISTAYIPSLVRFLKSEGLSEKDIFTNTRLLGVSEDDYPPMLCLQDCTQVLENVCPSDGRSPLFLGIFVGMFGKTGSLGTIGLIGICSETLDEALRNSQQFVKLISPLFGYNYVDEGNLVAIEFNNKFNTPEKVNDFVLGLFVGGIHALAHNLLGNSFFDYINESTANFRTSLDRYPDLAFMTNSAVGINVKFGSKTNRITFSKNMAMAKLPGANKTGLKTAIEVSSNLAENRQNITDDNDTSKTIVDSVKAILMSETGLTLSSNEISKELGISRRTLARQLSVHNATFSHLKSEVKMTLANEYICKTQMGIKEIAYKIGYSDVSNFSIAFKRHFGESPANHRAKDRAM